MIQAISTLTCLINRIIPEDEFPNAENNGVLVYLARFLGPGKESLRQMIELGCQLTEQESSVMFGQTVAELTDQQLDGLITEIQLGQVRTSWTI
ncbi:MAG: gluconate 2-dehydrogenase subunit 3 family protein, partial [Anaerolineales bacterium]|nr:gluconate 2-dehydrogenase subunit 3 family protein [Anaerolineales bacterium]